jgi:UDP-N-acetylglucosamine 1-carboxyvinyltransferase
MEKLIVVGGHKLTGSVNVSGSKNVVLKAMVAACLTKEEVVIENIPLISDVYVMSDTIKQLGGKVSFLDHKLVIKMDKFKHDKIFLEKAAEIRASFMLIVPILARLGQAIIPNPGGCRIGARPIDRIIDGLMGMGVSIEYSSRDGYFHAKLKNKKLKGTKYKFSKNTHTGTETMILAGVLATGKTIIENAAREPEIDELIGLLNKMGAKVKRVKPRTIEIEGVNSLFGTTFKIKPDRNEVATIAVAAILTEGDIFIKDIEKTGIEEFLSVFKKINAGYEVKKDGIRFYYKGELKPVSIETSFYPGFMTDWLGPMVVLLTKAVGKSLVHETIYENRLGYVHELEKMGANIELFNPNVKNPDKFYNFNILDDKEENFHAAKIFGPVGLHNAILNIPDLRAGATLVLAALAASGKSTIFGLEYLDRGYESFERRLKSLGADIERSNHE